MPMEVIVVTQSCKERVQDELNDRLTDIRKLWRLYRKNPDAYNPDLGSVYEYGLCFDYVAKGTFQDQRRGYFRWQLSWGGPSDEFRFYTDECLDPVEIEYWFLDWFDGAKIVLQERDYDLLEEIFQYFREIGVVEAERNKTICDC